MDLQIIQVVVGAIVAFGITYAAIPILRKVAYLTDLYDKPDFERKLHDRYVPTLGGIAIFLAFFVGFSISGVAGELQGFPYFAAALTLLFFTGLKDDIVDLSPVVKLSMELVAAGLLIFGCEMYISNFYGVFGIYEISYNTSVILTFFTLIVVTNSFNLIDGIDGLAAGVGIIASLCFGIGFLVSGFYALATLSLVLFVTLVSFLLYNFDPADIFMGDTGSLVVGFLLSVLAINFVGLNEVPEFTALFGNTSSILPVAILSLPLFDTITVFYKRLKKGISPFSPGQDHIHHSMIKLGFGHKGASILLCLCGISIVLITLLMREYSVNNILIVTVGSMFILLPTSGFKRRLLKRLGLDIELHLSPQKALSDYNDMKSEKEKESSSAVNSPVN